MASLWQLNQTCLLTVNSILKTMISILHTSVTATTVIKHHENIIRLNFNSEEVWSMETTGGKTSFCIDTKKYFLKMLKLRSVPPVFRLIICFGEKLIMKY